VLALPDASVLAAWYSGSFETSADCHILLSRFDGGDWSAPTVVVDTPGHADGNPVLFLAPDGDLCLFYVTLYGEEITPQEAGRLWTYWNTCRVHRLRSSDLGATWGPRETIREQLGWMTRNRPLLLSNGEIVLPLYEERRPRSTFLISADGGQTWGAGGEIAPDGNEQPALVEDADGALLAWMRQRGGGAILTSRSTNRGRNWTPAVPISLPNPDAAVDVIRLHEGPLLLAFNNSATQRTPLALAVSNDEGATWRVVAHLETGPGEFSYPSMSQAPTGALHLTYTWNRRTIKHLNLTPEVLAQLLY